MHKPPILLTNDDGIDSHFLFTLAQALKEHFSVMVVAPLGEKSWIGRAFTRYESVHMTVYKDGFDCPAWALDGTPSDCINIALGHLTQGEPVAVVSGINIGYNATLTSILSSGTIAGALEGALWGLPAFAFSMQVPKDAFDALRKAHGKSEEAKAEESLQHAAAHAANFVVETLQKPNTPLRVHNVNYPQMTTPSSAMLNVQPALIKSTALFQPESTTSYRFCYPKTMEPHSYANTDLEALERGCISYTALNYGTFANP
jgi:5'-nucleotidase